MVSSIALALSLAAPHRAAANNGLDFIGSGLESSAMGGAALAVARDPLALNTNPAGLAQLQGLRIEQHAAVAYGIDNWFGDSLNPRASSTTHWAPIADGAASRSLRRWPVTLGGGLFVQGGSGATYRDMATPFGTRDELAAKFGVVKATVGAAGNIGERLSAGLSVSVYYARLDQKVFPGTSAGSAADPAHAFFGTYFRKAEGISTGVKLGLQYRVDERLKLGAVYTSKVDLPLSGDRFIADESAIGLGRVTYHRLRLDGLAEPQTAGIGASYQATPRLLLALDLKWLDWSDALRHSTLTASLPDNPAAPALSLATSANWRDQYVVALGAAYDVDPAVTVWAGYNYGRNPVPAGTLNPLMPTIVEHHLTAGIGWRPAPDWRLGASVEFAVPNEELSTDTELPLGTGLRVSEGYVALHLGLGLVW
jgi:long-chain fatty acid transport protein